MFGVRDIGTQICQTDNMDYNIDFSVFRNTLSTSHVSQLAKLINRFFKNITRYRFSNSRILRLFRVVLLQVHAVEGVIPPHILYDLLLSDRDFLKIILFPSTPDHFSRDHNNIHVSHPGLELKICLLQLLHTLLSLPSLLPRDITSNTNLISTLLAGYGATTSPADIETRKLLYLFEDDEGETGPYVIAHYSWMWGRAAHQNLVKLTSSSSSSSWRDVKVDQQTLDSSDSWFYHNFETNLLDKGPSLNSNRKHPTARSHSPKMSDFLQQLGQKGSALGDSKWRYDPDFILPLLTSLVIEFGGSLDYRKLIQMGALSFIVMAMTSSDLDIRKKAYSVCSRIYQEIDNTVGVLTRTIPQQMYHFKARKQIRILLLVMRNAITEQFQRLPSLIGVFVSRSLKVLSDPIHHLYRELSRFLVKSPTLDIDDTPMFYELFNRSGINHCKDREWILDIIMSGLTSQMDIDALEKRKILPIIMTFYDSEMANRFEKNYILAILNHICHVRDGLGYWQTLVNRYGILAWIEGILSSQGISFLRTGPILILLNNIVTDFCHQSTELQMTQNIIKHSFAMILHVIVQLVAKDTKFLTERRQQRRQQQQQSFVQLVLQLLLNLLIATNGTKANIPPSFLIKLFPLSDTYFPISKSSSSFMVIFQILFQNRFYPLGYKLLGYPKLSIENEEDEEYRLASLVQLSLDAVLEIANGHDFSSLPASCDTLMNMWASSPVLETESKKKKR